MHQHIFFFFLTKIQSFKDVFVIKEKRNATEVTLKK